MHGAENLNRVSFVRLGELLRITNVTNKAEGTYECVASNGFHSDYSVNTLTVNSTFMKYHYLVNKSLDCQVVFESLKFAFKHFIY